VDPSRKDSIKTYRSGSKISMLENRDTVKDDVIISPTMRDSSFQ
jgi:hypothetical protein